MRYRQHWTEDWTAFIDSTWLTNDYDNIWFIWVLIIIFIIIKWLLLRSRQPVFFQPSTCESALEQQSNPWTRTRSMYSQFRALTSHSPRNNNGSPFGCWMSFFMQVVHVKNRLNSLRSGSLAWLAWNATKSWVVLWSRDLGAQKPGWNAA